MVDSGRDDDERQSAMWGVWHKVDPESPSDQIRFYYFHSGGIGLYRYGREGFAHTNSFDWQLQEDALFLRFRKTGEEHRVKYILDAEANILHFVDDPREPSDTKYRRARGPVEDSLALAAVVAEPTDSEDASHTCPLGMADVVGSLVDDEKIRTPAGHMWISMRSFATGGVEFSMYQFSPAAIDGRGVGWHHRGDFDDWSTEALHYRINGEVLELQFDRNGESHSSRYRLQSPEGPGQLADGYRSGEANPGDAVSLWLGEDPRNGWHRSTFTRMGRSFSRP
jgi:hypothetical protein